MPTQEESDYVTTDRNLKRGRIDILKQKMRFNPYFHQVIVIDSCMINSIVAVTNALSKKQAHHTGRRACSSYFDLKWRSIGFDRVRFLSDDDAHDQFTRGQDNAKS